MANPLAVALLARPVGWPADLPVGCEGSDGQNSDTVIDGSTDEEPGEVRGYRLEPDGTVREASVDAGQAEFRMVTAITNGPSGLVATGNDSHPDFENFVLTSPDGLSWTKPATTGLDVPMDVFDLLATDEAYIAVGTLRTADDPSRGGFVPAILTSTDGTTWSTSQTPSSDEGPIRSVVRVGSAMYAAGDVGGAPVLWSSTRDRSQ